MKLSIIIMLGLFAIISRPALASNEPTQVSPSWQERSEATATWMWLDIYNATLFTQAGFDQSKLLADDQPLKLKLCYLKPIGRDDLIKGAEAVLNKNLNGELKKAVRELHKNYVDVKPGDCYVLEYSPAIGTQLKLNDQLAYETKLDGFKSVYFGIWLGQNPLSDSLKEALLTPLEKGEKPLS